MTKLSEVHVTLSQELWNQFLHRSAATGVPLEWLVAGLVCGTLTVSGDDHRAPATPTRRHRYDLPIESDMSPTTPCFANSLPRRAASEPPALYC